ncbi:MAG TPA: DUF1778 domain-containing protein [Planctomycetota bacterium]|jgi:uncharacterized protein (DUF1778 family)
MRCKHGQKKRRGRPARGADGRTVNLTVRVSQREREALAKAADAAGMSVSEYIMRPHRADAEEARKE